MSEGDTASAVPLRRAATWGLAPTSAALVAATLVYLAGSILVVQLVRIAGIHGRLTLDLLSYQFLAVGTVIAALVVLQPHRLGLDALGYRLSDWSTILTVALAALPTMGLAIAVLYLFFNAFFPGYQLHGNAPEAFRGIPKNLGLGRELLLLAWAAVEAPLVEETLFRGIIFQGLRNFLARRLPYQAAIFGGAIVSGTLFGLAHREVHTLPVLILLGIILAYVFQLGRSVYASALVHGIINAWAVFGFFRGS